MKSTETIAAIATAHGSAAIGIIRISGKESLKTLRSIFISEKKGDFLSHKMYLGKIVGKNNDLIDEVMAVFFKGPNSFTGEDSIEIYCHGGYITVQKVLDRVLSAGARIANPGEFTERAFLNNRIDLTQAEAIADIIYAQSNKAQSIAQGQLAGVLGGKVRQILKETLFVYSHIVTQIDFPEEDVKEITAEEISKKLEKQIINIEELLNSSRQGLIYKNGVKVSIVGLPNAGKSSLLNSLVKDKRAIVTNIPGTTRDILEGGIELGGILFRLFDTAGITNTENIVEKEGIKRSLKSIKDADIILLVVERYKDVKKFFECIDKKIIDIITAKSIFLIKNKEDLIKEKLPKDLEVRFSKAITISTKNIKSIKKIEKLLLGQFQSEKSEESVFVTSVRQQHLLKETYKSLKRAQNCAAVNDFEDKILIELDDAKKYLEEVIGQEVASDVLSKVFSRFCIGK